MKWVDFFSAEDRHHSSFFASSPPNEPMSVANYWVYTIHIAERDIQSAVCSHEQKWMLIEKSCWWLALLYFVLCECQCTWLWWDAWRTRFTVRPSHYDRTFNWFASLLHGGFYLHCVKFLQIDGNVIQRFDNTIVAFAAAFFCMIAGNSHEIWYYSVVYWYNRAILIEKPIQLI